MARVVRLTGFGALLVLALVVIFLVAAAFLALKIIIWLLPVVIVALTALVLIYIFNRPPKKRSRNIDAQFRVKD